MPATPATLSAAPTPTPALHDCHGGICALGGAARDVACGGTGCGGVHRVLTSKCLKTSMDVAACDVLLAMSGRPYFEDADVIHVEDRVDPVQDIDIITSELRIKDLEYMVRLRAL